MNPLILSKLGFVRKKLCKNIACTYMEYTFGGNLPISELFTWFTNMAIHNFNVAEVVNLGATNPKVSPNLIY